MKCKILLIGALRTTLAEKDKELASKQGKLDDLQQRWPNATRFTDDELKRLFYPERIEIDKLSGGEDYDGKPGDDGVTVYLRPVDKQGDVIKVPGDITLQLYDLAAAPARNLIGEYRVPADQCSALWHGKLLTNHYTIKCPWPHGPPEHNEITIRVTFVDYFTKRILSAQATCTVKLPPQPTSAPASP